eukprot:TRINITY_DN3234_c0_g1_i1.p1 TRINITY_DN3234_c0_g1~~TRINITY_DN3234_c0_g1_i1.p1  ORF type:complete len:375 (-),score=26.70 TRINITY_DN3234_c0_g1_i1:4-1128(-)
MNLPYLLSGIIVLVSALISAKIDDSVTRKQFFSCAALSFAGYFIALRLIPAVASKCLDKGLKGKDINKKKQEYVPESLGIVSGATYLICVILCEPLIPFVVTMLGQYNAALTSICFMLFLGFADDVLDLRWSVKISFSFLATLPLLVAYSGPTSVIVPKPFRFWFGEAQELGYLYHLYMAFIAVFTTNSINIYAGVNGLETGQSFVISCAVLLHNFIELGGQHQSAHLLSLFLMMPFMSTTLALLYYNWYPSRVFVGDSFTYFSGMTFAVVGILSQFSKTLMLFFLPQLINFIISLPQLFKIVPCPRHRLPVLQPDGKLKPSYNFTVINLTLYLFGPMHERTLTTVLLFFQIFCCAIGFLIRYSHALTSIFYDA